jgi:hypothetical protein
VGREPISVGEKSCVWIVGMQLGIRRANSVEKRPRRKRLRVDRCPQRAETILPTHVTEMKHSPSHLHDDVDILGLYTMSQIYTMFCHAILTCSDVPPGYDDGYSLIWYQLNGLSVQFRPDSIHSRCCLPLLSSVPDFTFVHK